MRGIRKFLLGALYLVGMFGLTVLEIVHATGRPPDFTGLGVLAGGLSAGVGAIVWGNVQEHRSMPTSATVQKP